MMQPILFKVRLFTGPGDRPRSQTALLWLLEALCKVNQGHLEEKAYPALYRSGVRYRREDGTEEWLDIPTILAVGFGDCEDLACWRVAELRLAGVKASPYARFRLIKGVHHYHALVKRYGPRGRTWLEDPSRKLGMGPAVKSRNRGLLGPIKREA
jgi:hypothetical protein